MAIPKIRKDSILSALKFIDEHGIPDKHKSTQYELISSDDKKYPPKYVIAVANYIENGGEIVTTGYNAVEAKNYFESHGFKIQTKQEKTKDANINSELSESLDIDVGKGFGNYKNPYSKLLLESKNIVFRGAPGTGKSYLAKQIAADIISNGYTEQYTELTDEQKQQIEFVQFHPSYDYSDFVEGLRPKMNEDGSIGFELRDGVFKSFVEKARQNFENSHKPKEIREREASVNTIMTNFFSNIRLEEDEFKTIKGSKFTITNIDDKRIYIAIPGNETVDKLSLNIDEIRRMLESGLDFEKVSDITSFFGKQFATQNYSYDYALFKAIKAKALNVTKTDVAPEELKKYIFIIDEINRGEISKILGELFFSIDPGYRGKSGEVATQYSNMHAYPNEKFYIPENVFIIGTMNDIDRSVDSFDFAMRRRFRFIEVKAESTQNMLDLLEDVQLRREALARMDRLNEEILKVDDLNENYQIGAAYFLKLKNISFDDLWNDYLKPLLQDYVHGLYDEQGIMKGFAKAYGYQASDEGDADEAIEN